MKTNENPLLFRIVVCLEGEKKLDILVCIKAPTACVCTTRQVLLMVFGMAGIIHMVRPTRIFISKCFSFLRELTEVHSGACRRHLGHDHPEKIKSLTQKRRGTGVRTRLEPNSDGITPIPKRVFHIGKM